MRKTRIVAMICAFLAVAVMTAGCSTNKDPTETGTEGTTTLPIDVDKEGYKFGKHGNEETTVETSTGTETATEETTVPKENSIPVQTIGKRTSETAGDTTVTKAEPIEYDTLAPVVEHMVLDDVSLGDIYIGGTKLNIADLSAKEFTDTAKLYFYSEERLEVIAENFAFSGQGFALAPKPAASAETPEYDASALTNPDYIAAMEAAGIKIPTIPATPSKPIIERSYLFAEMEQNKKLVQRQQEADFEQYKIKGIGVVGDSLKESEKKVVCLTGNISIGTTETEVKKIFGEGVVNSGSENVAIYQNSTITMIVVYIPSDNGNVINEFYLLRNE